jgi:surfeit locus 1 family protein
MTRQRPAPLRIMLAALCVLACAGLVALGTWQVERLHWKHDLIARVDQRIHAAPVDAPGPDRWAKVTRQSDEYRHVRLIGTFLPQGTTLVQAVTDLGSGFWLLTPLRTADGSVVLINRGYVPSAAAAEAIIRRTQAISAGPVIVTGLLRITEPGGGFLRKNDPVANRWYSRDVQAITAARGLSGVAPYFVDADAAANPSGDYPVGGLTVVAFSDNHLVYALTWYALALMVAAGGLWALRQERRLPNGDDQDIQDVS